MSWKITFNAVTEARFAELHAEAIQFDQDGAFREAVQNLRDRLRTDSHEVGEIRYHLSQGEPVHIAVKGPVAFQFAIYQANSLVWITRVDRMASAME